MREEAERKRRLEEERCRQLEGSVKVIVGAGRDDREVWLKAGETFRDHHTAPEIVVVPKGKFWMGSQDRAGVPQERPRHEVTIPEPFAVGKYPVTFAERDAALAVGGVKHKPGDEGWGRGLRPVTNVSWDDAQSYVEWLSEMTGKLYRLLSEAASPPTISAFMICTAMCSSGARIAGTTAMPRSLST